MKIANFSKMSNKISDIRRFIAKEADLILNEYADDIIDNIKEDKSFKGNVLRNSFRKKKKKKYTLNVSTKKDYASYVEEGTRAHYIRPNRRKALKFTPAGVGKVVFSKLVKHPGTKATRFFSRAIKDADKNLKRNVLISKRRIYRRFNSQK